MISVVGNLGNPGAQDFAAERIANGGGGRPRTEVGGPSTVVELQGRQPAAAGTAAADKIVTPEQAWAAAADIASLLSAGDAGVQANLSGFDAARLLA